MKVFFVGAGPGDPDLITVKGRRIIQESEIIIYAGSLVNPLVFAGHQKDAEIYNSASLTLDEVIEIMQQGVAAGKRIARVHTGDPSIYGAIREQMDRLRALEIPFEVVPGVSSFLAAAAAINMEYTLPGISQTVILTRQEGRTPVPGGQKLAQLAKHRASLVIFLSVGMIAEVVAELIPAYGAEAPVAVIEKASWPEEKIVRGTLTDIAQKVQEAGIEKTALILVGDFLGDEYQLSRLYDPSFSHGYRRAES